MSEIRIDTPVSAARLRAVLAHAEAMAEGVTVRSEWSRVTIELRGLREALTVAPVPVADEVVVAAELPAPIAAPAPAPAPPAPEPEPEPVEDDEPDADELPVELDDREPAKASGPPRDREGSSGWMLLSAVADQGGTWEGTSTELILHAMGEDFSFGTARMRLRALDERGLVTIERESPRKVRQVCLTKAGWEHLGRMPTGINRGLNLSPPEATGDAGNFGVDTPIERRPVDLDAARARAAGAL